MVAAVTSRTGWGCRMLIGSLAVAWLSWPAGAGSLPDGEELLACYRRLQATAASSWRPTTSPRWSAAPMRNPSPKVSTRATAGASRCPALTLWLKYPTAYGEMAWISAREPVLVQGVGDVGSAVAAALFPGQLPRRSSRRAGAGHCPAGDDLRRCRVRRRGDARRSGALLPVSASGSACSG